MPIDWTPIIAQVLGVVVTGVIGLVGLSVRSFLQSKLNNEQLVFVEDVAAIAVQAAEQTYKAGNGEVKKEFALDFLEAELTKRGIKVDVDEISTIIEAAVMKEFNFPASVEPAPAPAETVVVAPQE